MRPSIGLCSRGGVSIRLGDAWTYGLLAASTAHQTKRLNRDWLLTTPVAAHAIVFEDSAGPVARRAAH